MAGLATFFKGAIQQCDDFLSTVRTYTTATIERPNTLASHMTLQRKRVSYYSTAQEELEAPPPATRHSLTSF